MKPRYILDRVAVPVVADTVAEQMADVLRHFLRCNDEAAAAKGKGGNMNGYGLVDLFDSVGHPFGEGEHKQQPYRSNDLDAAITDARHALARFEATRP